MIIKAGQIQSLTDARYFSSKEVNLIGFCFDTESPAFIPPREAQQIIGWLEGPKIVGEFGNQPLEAILEAAMILNLDLVQLCPKQHEDYSLLQQDWICNLKFDVSGNLLAELDFKALETPAKYVLLTIASDTDAVTVKKIIQRYKNDPEVTVPIMVSQKFNETNLLETLDTGINGIEISGNAEAVIGEKDFDIYDALFEVLQDEF